MLSKAYVSAYRILVTFIVLFGLVVGMRPRSMAQAQTTRPAVAAWHSDQVVHLMGLQDVREKAKGSLSIVASPASLIFATPAGDTFIDRSRILNVTLGDERIETGGTAGRVTRAIIPFGGGAAVATVTNKQVGLLTIEFLGEHDAQHGAVFLLPMADASRAYELLGSPAHSAQIEQSHTNCQSPAAVHPHSIEVEPIATLGQAVPVEYKVLLYEQLVTRLQERGAFAGVYRDGDDSPLAACPEYSLVLTLNTFKKGNAAVRASTGPVGYFVATTSLKFHVQVRDFTGKTVLDKDFKASQRGDSESLNLAGKIANTVTSELKKSSARSPWS